MISVRQQQMILPCDLTAVDQLLALMKCELLEQLAQFEQGENTNPITITLNIKQTVTQR